MNKVDSHQQSTVDIYSPISALFGEYAVIKDRISAVNDALDPYAMRYYFDAAESRSDYRASYSVDVIFDETAAIKALDAEFWQKTIKMTDVLEYMPGEKRNEWHEQIRKHKTPAFEQGIVFETMKSLIASREMFLAERVDGIFKNLSHEHVTNVPQGFGKRFIMGYTREYSSFNYQKAQIVHDLRAVIAKFMGRDTAKHYETGRDLDRLPRDGQWYKFDGGAWKIRLYKKGTAHMEVNPEMAYRLNQVLAYMHPHAIPNEFRTPPKKKIKEFELEYELVSFGAIEKLRELEFKRVSDIFECVGWKINDQARKVLEYLGGAKLHYQKVETWAFDYDPLPVIREICRSGMIPEQRSHQYYPTPDNIAQRVVEWADIQDDDDALEPSCGTGAIAQHIRCKSLMCVDISKLHCDVTAAKLPLSNVNNRDFLGWHPGRIFSKVCMNPPFADKRAEIHVRHAAGLLKEGGILVAVLPASYKNKTIVPGMRHEYSEVIHNEFDGCSVNVVLLRMSYGR